MRKAFFIGFTRGYVAGAHALINSIIVYHSDLELVLCYDEQTVPYIESIRPHLEQSGITSRLIGPCDWSDNKLGRWHVLNEILDEYDAICLMDADMFVTGRWDALFDATAYAGLIVGARDQSNRTYTAHGYSGKDGTPAFDDPMHHQEFCCSVPLILGKKLRPFMDEWMRCIEDENEHFGDMETMNIAMLRAGMLPKLLAFPTEQFTQVRLTFLSPKMRVIHKGLPENVKMAYPNERREGLLITDGHLRIRSMHGKYWSDRWVNSMITQMPKHIRNAFSFHVLEKYPDATDEQLEIALKIREDMMGKAKVSLKLAVAAFAYMLNARIPFDDALLKTDEERAHIESHRDYAAKIFKGL